MPSGALSPGGVRWRCASLPCATARAYAPRRSGGSSSTLAYSRPFTRSLVLIVIVTPISAHGVYRRRSQQAKRGAIVNVYLGPPHGSPRNHLPVGLQVRHHAAIDDHDIGIAGAVRERGWMAFEQPHGVTDVRQAEQHSHEWHGLRYVRL